MSEEQPSSSAPSLSELIGSVVQVVTASVASVILTVVGLLGLVVGIWLLFADVQTGRTLLSSCGSVAQPLANSNQGLNGCGERLSDQAVSAAAFVLGAVGYFSLLFPSTALSRALLIVGLSVAAATALALSEQGFVLVTVLGLIYSLGMTFGVARRSLFLGRSE